MEIERKQFTARDVKAADGEHGIIEAIVSTFDVTDRQGEVVRRGAFTKSLAKKLPRGVLAHDWSRPVARTLEARETPEGLYIKGQFNLETEDGRKTFSNIKHDLFEFSIGYRVIKDSFDKKAGVRNLLELELFEWSPVLVGAGSSRLLSTKAANAEESVMSAEAAEDYSQQFEQRLKALEEEKAKPIRPRFPGAPMGAQLHEVKSLGQGWAESREFKEWLANKPVESQVFHTGMRLKAVLTTTTGWPAESIRSGVVTPYPARQLRVAEAIPHIETMQNSFTYLEETTLDNQAIEIAEGALKPESNLALTERTSPIRKIATFLSATDEQLSDVPAVGDYLEQRLAYFVGARVDQQILNGNGVAPNLQGIIGTTGVQTQAKGVDPTPDAIQKAMDKIRVIGFAEPNLVVAHPNDWSEVKLLRETTGQYIWGSPSAAGPDSVWGKSVLVTSAMPEGTMLVGDFLNFVQIVERERFNIKIGYAGEDFLRNRKSYVGETRIGLVVYRPTAFCLVTGV